MSNEWIPVTDGLPKEGENADCLVAVKLADGRHLTIRAFWTRFNEKWCFTQWNDYYDGVEEVDFVAAWMPTPVYIPKEGE